VFVTAMEFSDICISIVEMVAVKWHQPVLVCCN
jgi:hypothetical protein